MISLLDVHKRFGDHNVLNGVSIEVPRQKITIIIGRSGEGKSVTLKHMIGLMQPDAGQIIVDGIDLASLNDGELTSIRKRFGMLFQNAALFDSMNVFDNIAFPLREHSRMSSRQIRDRVHELMGLVELAQHVETKFPSELSGGMRKRTGLARAIALKPDILLYDEPTTGLDPVLTDVIDQLIHKTHKTLGVTSIIISHDLQSVFDLADQIVFLYRGTVRLAGTVDDFKSSQDPVIANFLAGRATSLNNEETE